MEPRLIAHRGNVSGRNPSVENKPAYLLECLQKGFDAEIDVWLVDGKFSLGHDSPTYEINEEFLAKPGFWCHAKNLEALEAMSRNKYIHYFWHQTDFITITSFGWLWTFPGHFVENAVLNQFEWFMKDMTMNAANAKAVIEKLTDGKPIRAICSDWIGLLVGTNATS